MDGKLTSSKWAKLAKCSQDTASRDIDDLLKRNMRVFGVGQDDHRGRLGRILFCDSPVSVKRPGRHNDR